MLLRAKSSSSSWAGIKSVLSQALAASVSGKGLRRAAGKDVGLTFVPHLTPMIRGIHSTLYATVVDRSVDLQALYEKRYATSLSSM